MMKKVLFITFGVSISLFGLLFAQPARAISTSLFDPTRIIDDGIFYNSSSMTVDQIQAFLNSKVPTCDNWGTQTYSGTTRAAYSRARGVKLPLTCLKDYYENPTTLANNLTTTDGQTAPIPSGAESAAQIIHDASVTYNINPQALIVLLQKEQALVTDDWPWPIQYRSATGYGCPDSSVCNSQYYGFYNQVTNAAAQFRRYANYPNNYNYVPGPGNYVQYNPSTSCGGTYLNIQNQATASLYDYTPYQPNTSALAAGYGTGDSCGAYGNRNFWLYFNDWFGETTNNHLLYSVIKVSNSPALYLQTSAGKYYIPSQAILADWGLDKHPVQQVTQAYLDALPTHDWLDHLLKDDWGNLFFVDAGKLHYIPNKDYVPLWGLDASKAVQSLGMVYTMPGGTWVGRFVQDVAQPGGQIWLVDNGQKRAVSGGDMLYQWGYTPNQLMIVSSAYLAAMPTASDASRLSSDGTNNYLIDTGRKIELADNNIENDYAGSATPTTYSSLALSFLPTDTNGWQFVVGPDGRWYMLEGGRKHYITKGSMATIWGRMASRPLTKVSTGFLGSIPDGGNLSYLVSVGSPAQTWLIDKSKHLVPAGAVAAAWIPSGTTIPSYTSQSIESLPQGADATTEINGNESPFTYALDGGVKRYLTTQNAKNAWGGSVLSVSNELVNLIPEGSFVNYTVKDRLGQAYLLMNGTAYPIDSSFLDVWGISGTTPTVADNTISRFTAGSTLKAFIKIGTTYYIMVQGGKKSPILRYADTYKLDSLTPVALPSDYFPSASEASLLITSSQSANANIWLINQGKKIPLTFEQAVTYGYLSHGIQPTQLSPSTLDLITTDSQEPSLLIQSNNSGIKLLSFGYALGFSSGDTLLSYISASNPIMQVSPSVFDSFALTRAASRLVKDDQSSYYWMESGQKRHILNDAALNNYRSTPTTYLEGTTMYLLPNGQDISQ